MATATSVATPSTQSLALLRSFERHLRAERKSKETLSHYLTATRQFLEFCQQENLPALDGVSREHLEMWLERLHQTMRPYSVKNRFIGVRIFFRWLHQEGEITRDPTARIKIPSVDEVQKDVVDGADVQRVLTQLSKGKRDRDAAIIAALYDTGLRASELAGLKLQHVNLDTGICFIEKSKNHRTRVVKLSPATIRYVDRYLRRAKREPVYLFEGKRGQMTRSGIYAIVSKAFRAAGSTATIGVHDMRHSSATAASAEMSESEMMSLYGWTNADMARHYARKALEANALAAHDRASPMMRIGKR